MLNRYLTKTLFKGIGAQRATMNLMKTAALKHNYSLFKTNKMTFFDYDNKDKNLFSSDEEEYQDDSLGFSQDMYTEEKPKVDTLDGMAEVEEIPLYIFKMRGEIQDMKRRNWNEDKTYFPNFK